MHTNSIFHVPDIHLHFHIHFHYNLHINYHNINHFRVSLLIIVGATDHTVSNYAGICLCRTAASAHIGDDRRRYRASFLEEPVLISTL